MGSAQKSPVKAKKNTSLNEKPAEMPESNESVKKKKPLGELVDEKNYLEAFDTPVPLVIPPDDSRTLHLRNCGTNEVTMKLTVQNREASAEDTNFEVKPAEATVKPNKTLAIQVFYKPDEEKESPNSKKKSSKGPKKNKDGEFQRRHALLEAVLGKDECFYMYPVLGSNDPNDEKVATQKHIDMTKGIIDSDEEDPTGAKSAPKDSSKAQSQSDEEEDIEQEGIHSEGDDDSDEDMSDEILENDISTEEVKIRTDEGSGNKGDQEVPKSVSGTKPLDDVNIKEEVEDFPATEPMDESIDIKDEPIGM